MKMARVNKILCTVCIIALSTSFTFAQDWPQWQGPNRDAKVTGFAAPETWPEKLTQKWNITVGVGSDATPALVGDRLYVFTRQGGDEVILCLNADTGDEIWRDSYAAEDSTTADRGHAGPRSSPAVADGKIVTFGINGMLSCLDTATGKVLWRKNDFPGALPQFHTAMSPIIIDGLCIGHFGGQGSGAVVAYDLTTGEQKWKWDGPGPSYSSPAVMTVEDTKMVVVMTENNVVGINIADGTFLWEMPFDPGRGRQCATPIIDGQNVICCSSSQGMRAVRIEKKGDSFVVDELWNYSDNNVEYNTPVIKNGLLFAFSQRDSFFCVNAETGQTAWVQSSGSTGLDSLPSSGVIITPAGFGGGRGGGMGGGRGGRGGGGMGGGGFGSVVDAGSVLIGLNSSSRLVAFEPNDKEYRELASYQVSDGQTYAYPIVAGNRIYTRDQTSVTLWTIE